MLIIWHMLASVALPIKPQKGCGCVGYLVYVGQLSVALPKKPQKGCGCVGYLVYVGQLSVALPRKPQRVLRVC